MRRSRRYGIFLRSTRCLRRYPAVVRQRNINSAAPRIFSGHGRVEWFPDVQLGHRLRGDRIGHACPLHDRRLSTVKAQASL